MRKNNHFAGLMELATINVQKREKQTNEETQLSNEIKKETLKYTKIKGIISLETTE